MHMWYTTSYLLSNLATESLGYSDIPYKILVGLHFQLNLPTVQLKNADYN